MNKYLMQLHLLIHRLVLQML